MKILQLYNFDDVLNLPLHFHYKTIFSEVTKICIKQKYGSHN